MAFRSSAIASSSGGGDLTATPAGVQAHDYLGALYVQDFVGRPPTYPSGWTERVNADGGVDGQTARYADKDDASGSDSFTFTVSFSNQNVLITAAWSGRDNSAPRSATPVLTAFRSANSASPISDTINGITALNADDIAVMGVTDQPAGANRWTYSAIASYTEQYSGVSVDWVSGITLQTRDAVGAGATGNFSTTITDSLAGSADRAGIVVAIKAAAAGGAPIVSPSAPSRRMISWTRAAS